MLLRLVIATEEADLVTNRVAVGLTALLVSGVVTQLFKALWLYSRLPQGVILIAVVMAVLAGIGAWGTWLKHLRYQQLQQAQNLQQQSQSFSYFVQAELVERQLDLTPESRQDLQTKLLRFDQGMPIVLAAVGVILGLM